MKSSLRLVAALLIGIASLWQASAQTAPDNSIRDGGEYLIYNCYYGRLLGGNADNSSPVLSVEGTNAADSYVFVAEKSSLHEGYYWLKQKSTGKYLQASNAEGNTWSVWLAGSLNPSYNSYEWKLENGVKGTIVSNRGEVINSEGNVWLAPDPDHEKDTYISVYYDKPLVDRARWQIVDANYPLDQSRYALFVDQLKEAIARGEEVMSNPAYGTESEKSDLAAALYNARTALEKATSIADADTMGAAIEALLAAIENTMDGNYEIWASASSFATGSAYTVALKGVKVSTAVGAACQMAIRGANGLGALVEISASEIAIADKKAALTSGAHDLQFAFNCSSVDVYLDGSKAFTADQAQVATVTAVGQKAEWTLLGNKALTAYRPEIISLSRAMDPSQATPNNANGKPETNAIKLVGQDMQLSGNIDYHVLSSTAMADSKLAISGTDAWVIFDNVRPSYVVDNYLSGVTINGKAAELGTNCRVEIYLQGAALIPHADSYAPFIGYTEPNYGGDIFTLGLGNNNQLGENANTLRSFKLKRGYMVTLATNSDGSGYSRVFVADHKDKEVTLPDLLDRRVSFIYVRPWKYVSKKGWCNTGKDEELGYTGALLGATWFYTWSADRESQLDMEFIPMKCHRYWPGWDQFDKLNSTAALLLNEPEHSEQHTSDRCSCGGTTDPWTSCTMNPDLFHTGMRIGGPSPTDASYLTQYVGHCNDMAYRVDFVGYHAYWGTNEAANASAWRSRLKSIYDNTKRPIWLTEWNNGASWTNEQWPSSWSDKLDYQRRKVKEVIEMLDEADFIERYSIFNLPEDQRKVLKWDSDKGDWWVTPAGEAYHDHISTHAYKESMQFVPTGWFPSKKDVDVKLSIAQDGTVTIVYNNPNGDFSAEEAVMYMDTNDVYQPLLITARHELDNTSERTFTIDYTQLPAEAFAASSITYRLQVTTLKGDVVTSSRKAATVPSDLGGIIDGVVAEGLVISVDGTAVTFTSAEAQTLPIYATSGAKVAEVALQPGVSATVTLAPGVYLAGARKIVVR